MAVGKMYKVKSATFGGTVIKGAVRADVNPNAKLDMTRADGAVGVTKIFTEGHFHEVQVTCESNENQGTWNIGDVGSLVIVAFEQEVGAGPVASGDKTLTFPAASSASGKAVVASIKSSYPIEGKPTFVLTFNVFDDAGDRTKLMSIA